MFYKLIEKYSDIITDFSISNFRRYSSAFSLVAKLEFIDGSSLHLRDYLFIDGKRKYSYHWQSDNGDLISRWDNSPHHQNVSTFPHHRHIPGEISKSQSRNLADVLEIIHKNIKR